MANWTTLELRDMIESWWDELSEEKKIEIFKKHNPKVVIE